MKHIFKALVFSLLPFFTLWGNGTGHAKYQRESSAGCAGIVDLTRYPNGVSLQYPAVNGLYFSQDGKSLVAVEYYQVSKISPKN